MPYPSSKKCPADAVFGRLHRNGRNTCRPRIEEFREPTPTAGTRSPKLDSMLIERRCSGVVEGTGDRSAMVTQLCSRSLSMAPNCLDFSAAPRGSRCQFLINRRGGLCCFRVALRTPNPRAMRWKICGLEIKDGSGPTRSVPVLRRSSQFQRPRSRMHPNRACSCYQCSCQGRGESYPVRPSSDPLHPSCRATS
jgi:hypothetical protein